IEFLAGQEALMHRDEHFTSASDVVFGPFDDDLVPSRGDQHAKAVFDLNEVGIELPEQRAQCRLLVEENLGPRAARGITPVLGMSERRSFLGASCLAGHALLSAFREEDKPSLEARKLGNGALPWKVARRAQASNRYGLHHLPMHRIGPCGAQFHLDDLTNGGVGIEMNRLEPGRLAKPLARMLAAPFHQYLAALAERC